ncbi:MAG: hypothetical protein MJE63_17255 [Proteobacteria bacterium]|nr:hypothetical protein [Pseudomonadota bacterium]
MITEQDYLKLQNFPDEIESISIHDMQFAESVNSTYEDVKISSVVGIAHGRHEKHTTWSDVLLALIRFESKQELLENPSLIFDEELCKKDSSLKNGFYFYRINNKLYLAQGMHRFIIMKFAGIQIVRNIFIDERVFRIPPELLNRVKTWGYTFKKDWFAKKRQSNFQLCKANNPGNPVRSGTQIGKFLTRADFDTFLAGIKLDALKTLKNTLRLGLKKLRENEE